MNEAASRSRGLLGPASLRRTLLGAAVIGSMMLAAGCHTGPGPQHTEVGGGKQGRQLTHSPEPPASLPQHESVKSAKNARMTATTWKAAGMPVNLVVWQAVRAWCQRAARSSSAI
jgi:hypothetical protein